MKKILFVLLSLIVCVSLFSCAEEAKALGKGGKGVKEAKKYKDSIEEFMGA